MCKKTIELEKTSARSNKGLPYLLFMISLLFVIFLMIYTLEAKLTGSADGGTNMFFGAAGFIGIVGSMLWALAAETRPAPIPKRYQLQRFIARFIFMGVIALMFLAKLCEFCDSRAHAILFIVIILLTVGLNALVELRIERESPLAVISNH